MEYTHVDFEVDCSNIVIMEYAKPNIYISINGRIDFFQHRKNWLMSSISESIAWNNFT